jgi:methionyl-tRNA formyltransferase
MRIVFFGTPEFAIPSLEAVLAAGEVVAVVTRPCRPRGRGLRVEPPPVARIATEYALDLLQPGSLRTPEFLARLRSCAPDLVVAVAFGRIIPPDVLAIPPHGGVNLHPSLLPRYRGAAPIQRAIAAGDAETGVTVLHITDELDAGDIILQRAVPIAPDDTGETLEARLAQEGAALLAEAVSLIESDRAPRRPQDPALVTFAPKVTREEALIRWRDPASRIVNLVRAFVPWPVAYTVRDGEPLRIWRASAADLSGAPGMVLAAGAGEGEPIAVAAGQGAVLLHEVQPVSGRRMSAAAYVRGHRLRPGTMLGDQSQASQRAQD